MATTAGHRLTLDPMGKCSNAFFSETTNMIKAKLYMNVHWMVTKEKDKQAKVESYKQLKTRWGKHTDKNNIVDFWLATDPKLTIIGFFPLQPRVFLISPLRILIFPCNLY
jgi:hypothetical protein